MLNGGEIIVNDNYSFEENLIINADDVFKDTRIISLKTNKMKIEYDEIESFGGFSIYSSVNGAYLSK